MNESERSLCFFRQMEAAAERFDNEAELDSDIAAFNALAELRCKVGDCAINGNRLLEYINTSGRFATREEIDGVVAPSCVILDNPYEADSEFKQAQEILRQPPEGL